MCGGTNTVWAASAPAERGKVLGLCTSGAGIGAFRAARDASYSGSRADITPIPAAQDDNFSARTLALRVEVSHVAKKCRIGEPT